MACTAWVSNIFLGIIVYFNKGINCEPDITLLARISNNDYKYTCIIGNESYQSVAFLTPFSVTYLQIASEYRTLEGKILSDEFNCDFEHECSKVFENIDWETVQSVNHLLPIIHDIRFESLNTYRTFNEPIPFEISERDFYFPVSVRAEEEPQILMCTEGNENIIQCYWIRIEEDEDKFKVFIRDCGKVRKTQFSIKDSSCILVNLTEHNSYVAQDWDHYILLRNENKIILKNAVTNQEYFTLDDVKYDIKKIYLITTNRKRGEWKIHKNSYLRLKTFDSEVQLGSTFSAKNTDNICISMFVSICQGCSLEIRINNQTKERFIGNAEIWRNINLTSVSTQTNEFKIFVKGSRSEHSDIIAIDNIRLCHEHEIRILSINNKFKLSSISCKALSYSTWYSTLNYTSRSSNDVCANATYIGKNCDIPCSAVLGQSADTEFCNKHFICKPTENYNEQNCVCAAGYRGPNCDETCISHHFGYNCQKQCGQCKSNVTCLKSSGICLGGCEPDYVQNMCIFKRYEPVNLFGTVDENGLIELNWLQTEFVTKYKIIVTSFKSAINKNISKIEEDINVNISDRNEKYSYKLKERVLLCSFYIVKVCGEGKMTHCANITLVTSPEKPVLTKNYITVEDIDAHSKIIKIPGIEPSTKCVISHMFIIVCDESGNGKKYKINSNDSEILSEAQVTCSGTYWIASRKETNLSEVTFIIGEGKKSTNEYDNSPLEANNQYNICVILRNVYENKSAYNVYYGNNNKTSSVWEIVGIIIIVLVGLVGLVGLGGLVVWCIKKFFCYKSERINSGNNFALTEVQDPLVQK